MKTKVDYNQLYDQLDNLMKEAPCKGRSCVGHQNCEYGINGCYGIDCAIEIVQLGIDYYQRQEVT